MSGTPKPEDNFYSDLHCHPALRPVNLDKKTLWHTLFKKKKLRKIIKAQLKGKRGVLYDQSGYPKLSNGKVKIVFASLYPLEQGFMANNNFLLSALNAVFKSSQSIGHIFDGNRNAKHLRDYFLSLFIRFPKERIQFLKTQEYWPGFLDEYNAYLKENRQTLPIHQENVDEINQLSQKRKKDFPNGFQTQTEGTFLVADRNWDGFLPDGDKVLTILTIEGMGIISQTKRGAAGNLHGTRTDTSNIGRLLRIIKGEMPILFITFSHHFSSGLCGHARSMPDVARDLNALRQDTLLDAGFTPAGYQVLQYLLSVRENNGRWVDEPSFGRRVYIDVKHMSLKGRLTLYQLVQNYNQGKSGKKRIPIIASHVGFSGLSISQMLTNIRQGTETTRNQIASNPGKKQRLKRPHTYNTWSINLGIEEIRIIVDSGGLIGISLEQNILGIPFGKKTKKKDQSFFTYLVLNQILDMAKAAKTPKFWDHVMMGTDFDGVIDPIDHYSSALFFHSLKVDMANKLKNEISDGELAEAFLNRNDIDLILHKIFIGNAFQFMQDFFDPTTMPVFQTLSQ